MIVGDTNVHLDDTRDEDARRFISLLDFYKLKQNEGEGEARGHVEIDSDSEVLPNGDAPRAYEFQDADYHCKFGDGDHSDV